MAGKHLNPHKPKSPTQKEIMNTLTQLPNITLYYREGSSDKVYQCQIEQAGERFVVNFAYGRRGSTLNTGSKTNVPVTFDGAKRIFDKLVKEKQAKGYTEGESGTPYQHSDQQPSGIIPQLLNSIDESQVLNLMNDDNWCMQEKHDGRRLIVRKSGKDITGINKKGNTVGLALPLFDVVRGFDADVTIDGEAIGDILVAFDLLELDGVDIRSWPYRERLAALMNLLFSVQQRVIKLVETAFTTEQKLDLLNRLKQGKREGIVFKQIFAAYTPGRPNSGGNQLKHKFVATLSALVSKVNKQRSIGISLLGHNGWQTAGNVTIPANHKIPQAGDVVEVRFLYAHRESDVLYQPVYLGPRDDVDSRECKVSQLKYKPEDEE
jgi:bifunctional non-homologous end joining protein LigD